MSTQINENNANIPQINSSENAEDSTGFFNTDIGKFVAKTLIFFVVLIASANLFLPDAEEFKKFDTDRNRLIGLSFIQNPRVLWKISEDHEKSNKIDKSITDMEIAIGLLEMHGATKETMSLYKTRLATLQSKK